MSEVDDVMVESRTTVQIIDEYATSDVTTREPFKRWLPLEEIQKEMNRLMILRIRMHLSHLDDRDLDTLACLVDDIYEDVFGPASALRGTGEEGGTGRPGPRQTRTSDARKRAKDCAGIPGQKKRGR